MHVDWDTIRQRPQALATEFARLRDFDVRVLYLPTWRRRQLVPSYSCVRRLPVPQFPFARLGAIRTANLLVARLTISLLLKLWPADVLFVTHPLFEERITKRLRHPPIVYDCMDLYAELARDASEAHRIAIAEAALVQRAAAITTSSSYLRDYIRSTAPPTTPVVLVRNAASSTELTSSRRRRRKDDLLRLGYFGAISEWIDHDLIVAAVSANADVRFHLYGPRTVDWTHHERVAIHPPVAHDRLPTIASQLDALVVPFVITPLTRAVDPIKLYEYVSYGLPIFARYYPELDQFEGVVNFYHNREQFMDLVSLLRRDPHTVAPTSQSAADFLAKSTWRDRARVMASAIRHASTTSFGCK